MPLLALTGVRDRGGLLPSGAPRRWGPGEGLWPSPSLPLPPGQDDARLGGPWVVRLVDRQQVVGGGDHRPRRVARWRGEHPAHGDGGSRRLVDDDLRHRPHGGDRGKQPALVGRRGLVDRERLDGRAAEAAEVGAGAEQVSEVGGEGSDVRAGRAVDFDRENGVTVGPGRHRLHVEPVDAHRARVALDLDPVAGELVETSAIDPQRRDHRRHLLDVTGQSIGDHSAHRRRGRPDRRRGSR